MDIFDVLHSRRSIRAFTEEQISDEQVHTLLDAAMIAPSAGNAMPWHFVVIRDKKIREQIPVINPYATMVTKAPLSILVCGNLSLEKYQGFWVQDCSAAVQNLLLAATALELGSVWTGVYPIEERVKAFQELCKLPETLIPFALVVIGHPAQKSSRKSRYDEAKVSQNTW